MVLTTGFHRNEVFRLADASCSLAEARVYLATEQNLYESVYGDGIWSAAGEDGTLEERLKEITSITTLLNLGNTPEMILQYVLGEFDLEINERLDTRFHCGCTKSRVARALISVGRKDLSEMIEEGKPIQVNCHFCGRNYEFSVEELKELLSRAVR